MQKIVFPKNFLWGAATAAYQIEGGAKEDGRGDSIWDTFCRTPGKVFNGDTGDVACDHYHRYKDDVKMMKELGLKAYRFSIAWSRIYPDGKGNVNKKGIDFYRRLVDELKQNGIEPFVTLYHWDLPQKLQDIGGWDNRDVADYFADYSLTMFDSLGDSVKKWFTLNEPWVTAFVGYGQGRHAPGIVDEAMAVRATHTLALAHAKAVGIYKGSKYTDGKVGIVINVTPSYPKTDSQEDRLANTLHDGYLNRWFYDICFLGRYPEDIYRIYRQKLNAPVIKDGDLDLIRANRAAMVGVNQYFKSIIRHSDADKTLKFEVCEPEGPVTDMPGWEIYPKALYDFLTRVRQTYGNPETYITENGAAFKDDKITDGIVDDRDRIEYLRGHIAMVYKAMAEGLDLRGYFVWSLMDNFEWAYGYSKRFGIVHVNYENQARTWKKSAHWYKDLVNSNTLV